MFCKTFKKMFQLTLKFKKRVQGVKSLTTEVTMAVQVPSLPRYSGFKGSSIAEAPIQSLARECPYTMGAAIKKKCSKPAWPHWDPPVSMPPHLLSLEKCTLFVFLPNCLGAQLYLSCSPQYPLLRARASPHSPWGGSRVV